MKQIDAVLKTECYYLLWSALEKTRKGGGLLNLQISVIAPRPSQFSTLLEKNIPLKNTALFNTYISRKYHAEADLGISKGGGAVYAPSHIHVPYVFVVRVKNKIY